MKNTQITDDIAVKKSKNERIVATRITLTEYGELCIRAGKENISISELIYRSLFDKAK